jgi:hypothetical protein
VCRSVKDCRESAEWSSRRFSVVGFVGLSLFESQGPGIRLGSGEPCGVGSALSGACRPLCLRSVTSGSLRQGIPLSRCLLRQIARSRCSIGICPVCRNVEPFCELVDIIRGIVDEHFGDTVVKDGLIGSTEGGPMSLFREGSEQDCRHCTDRCYTAP